MTVALETLVAIPIAFWSASKNVRSISSLIVLFAVIPVYHWAGKVALGKRNLPVPDRFMGWSIFWQGLGLTLLLGLGTALVLFAPRRALAAL